MEVRQDLFDRRENTESASIDTALYRLFPNYAGMARNSHGAYPLSYLELSRPTGRYVSRWLLQELNVFTRRHSIIMIGNNCVPGYFFPKLETGAGVEQFFQNRPLNCGIFIANVPGNFNNLPGAVVFQAEPFMVLNMRQHWTSAEAYLADMHSKYRVRTKKVLELSSGLEMKRFYGDGLEKDLIRKCAAMLQHTLREKTLAMNKNLEGILERFAEHFGSQFRVHVYYQQGKPVGFITCSISNRQLIAWHVGYEAAIAKETHIYQRMLFDLIDLGMQERVQTMNLGRTATEIKSTFGAEPIENQFVVFARNPVLRAMLRFYKKHHFRPKEFILRRPFKV
jgi:hypothetical protein